MWMRGQDLNLGPSVYEPDELPGCSTPRRWCFGMGGERKDPAGWPGGDRLSRCLSNSTMGAEVFHGRVRDGIGCINLAMTTGPPGRILGGMESVSRVG